MKTIFALLAAAALCWPSVASADSDGSYCSGPGYIAWETRFAPAEPSHQLHIVRFSTTGGIERLAPIALPDFQVHGMTCGASVVELRGMTNAHSVDLSAPGRPKVTVRHITAAERRPTAENLGVLARADVIDLQSDGARGEFQLVIAQVSKSVEGGLEHHTISSIVRRGNRPFGSIVASLVIYQGMREESVH